VKCEVEDSTLMRRYEVGAGSLIACDTSTDERRLAGIDF
jgi:hypothetical protein